MPKPKKLRPTYRQHSRAKHGRLRSGVTYLGEGPELDQQFKKIIADIGRNHALSNPGKDYAQA